MTSKVYNDVKKAIKAGHYKLVRLIRHDDNEVMIPYNKVSGGEEKALERLDFIKLKCTSFLPNGHYVLQCRISAQNSNIVECFDIKINKTLLINQENIEDKTKEQEMKENVTLDDYILLLQENANLKVENETLKFKIHWYEDQAKNAPVITNKGLGDSGESILADVFKDALPSIMNMGDRYFDLEEQKLTLQHKSLNSGLVKKATNNMAKKKTQEPSFEDEIAEEVEFMQSLNEEDFDKEMTILAEEDPELYEAVCEELGITGEEEEEQEEAMQLNDEEAEEEEGE